MLRLNVSIAGLAVFGAGMLLGQPLTAVGTTPSKDTGQFTFIDVPGATSTGVYQFPERINARGDIVGPYRSADGKLHGFLLDAGAFTTIDFPSAAATTADGINDEGQIVGLYSLVAGGPNHGYLLSAGAFTTIDFPGAVATIATGVSFRQACVGGMSVARQDVRFN